MSTSSLSPDTAFAIMQQAQHTVQSSENNLKSANNAQRIKETARDFEAVFLSEMLKPMFEGIESNEMFGGGKGEEVFHGMLVQEYGKKIAEKDITGIQTQVMNAMIEMQAQRSASEGANARSFADSGKIIDLDIIE